MGGLVNLQFVRRRWERDPLRGSDLVRDTFEKVDLIRKRLLTAKSR